MRYLLLICMLLAVSVETALSAVEVAVDGAPVHVIEEVYHREGMAYVAIDDLLPALGLSGSWDAVAHTYRISGAFGEAVISPGSRFLRQGGGFEPLEQRPRFIDGRLRVSDEFIRKHLLQRVAGRAYYRNLNPGSNVANEETSAMDRLFSFLLRKQKPSDAPVLRAVAIDPGHGGQDPGCIGLNGVKEKDVALAIAQRLEKQLKMELGIPVYMTRDADYALGIEERLRTAAQGEVDALLLIHAQSSFSLQARGVYLYIRSAGEGESSDTDSRRLAELLAVSLKKAGFVVRGITAAPLSPLGQGDLPTVLVETGFLTNPEDRPLLDGEDGQKRLASALYDGLRKFGEKRQKDGVS